MPMFASACTHRPMTANQSCGGRFRNLRVRGKMTPREKCPGQTFPVRRAICWPMLSAGVAHPFPCTPCHPEISGSSPWSSRSTPRSYGTNSRSFVPFREGPLPTFKAWWPAFEASPRDLRQISRKIGFDGTANSLRGAPSWHLGPNYLLREPVAKVQNPGRSFAGAARGFPGEVFLFAIHFSGQPGKGATRCRSCVIYSHVHQERDALQWL